MHRNGAKEGGLLQNHCHSGLTKHDMIQQGFVTMCVYINTYVSHANTSAALRDRTRLPTLSA